jgi:hypothetical protein
MMGERGTKDRILPLFAHKKSMVKRPIFELHILTIFHLPVFPKPSSKGLSYTTRFILFCTNDFSDSVDTRQLIHPHIHIINAQNGCSVARNYCAYGSVGAGSIFKLVW